VGILAEDVGSISQQQLIPEEEEGILAVSFLGSSVPEVSEVERKRSKWMIMEVQRGHEVPE